MFKRSKARKLLRQLQLKQLDQPEPVPRQDYLSERECHRTYSCIHCRAHLANHDELISKLFQGNQGRAYLFNKVVNVGCKQAVERELLTGLHAVADIYCDCCETTLGWKYEQAFVPSQKYKEGKYIIELAHMLKENNWDLTSYNSKELLEQQLANELAEQSISTGAAIHRPLVDAGESLAPNQARYLSPALASGQLGRHSTPALDTSRRHISNSSSYTTLRTAQLESNFNLNIGGASSEGASSSGSRENLGQSASLEGGNRVRPEQRADQRKLAAVGCLVEVANLQDKTNRRTTTRETFEIDRGQ